MAYESKHVNVWIERPAGEVYDYVVQPENLPHWASGLASSTIEQVDGEWVAESPMGRVGVKFAPRNDFGILDHDVTLPDGSVNTNPVRVIAGDGGCEVDFVLRRLDGVSDDDFAADATTIDGDLHTLKQILEAQ